MNILTTYTLKYLQLNRKRTGVTVLGVLLSSALICGVFLLGVSFQKLMIDHEITTTGNWHAQFFGVPYAKANISPKTVQSRYRCLASRSGPQPTAAKTGPGPTCTSPPMTRLHTKTNPSS